MSVTSHLNIEITINSCSTKEVKFRSVHAVYETQEVKEQIGFGMAFLASELFFIYFSDFHGHTTERVSSTETIVQTSLCIHLEIITRLYFTIWKS